MKAHLVIIGFFLAFGWTNAQNTVKDKPSFLRADLVREFRIQIPQSRLDSIMQKVKNTKLPRQMPASEGASSSWETGMDITWLKQLQSYWVNKFDWRAQERLLNSYPQYIARVDDIDIQFYYIKGEGKNPTPLVLTHGWPGSTFEFFETIAPLTRPSQYGGKAEDAFTLIIPALPGFGFSSMPKKPVNAITTATLWHKLVTEIIGHKTFFAQGGDWGAGVTVRLAYMFPESVKAIHINFFPGIPVAANEQTEEEKIYFASIDVFRATGFDYWRMQANKPMMPAVALADSPMGTAGWIAEKFWAWADHGGNLDAVINKDRLLTNIMLYVANNDGIDGSFWFYRGAITELRGASWPGFVKTPTSISKYPKDLPVSHPPESTAKRGYNVVRYTDIPKGGHFAAMEQPVLFAEDIRNAFRPFR